MWLLYAATIIVGALLGFTVFIQGKISGASYAGASIVSESEGSTALTTLIIIMAIVYFMLIFATSIITFIIIILRFYRNLLQGEGYLMHTLPVKTSDLIWSTLIVAYIWQLLALAAAGLSMLIVGLTSGILPFMIRTGVLAEISQEFMMVFGKGYIWYFVFILISIAAGILMCYFSMAIGNLANVHKLLFSVVAYIGINIVVSVINMVIMIPRMFNQVIIADELAPFSPVNITNVILTVIMGVAFFIGTNYILKRKLNLA